MEPYTSINYILDEKNYMELVVCENSRISYPLHNHISVYTAGIILKGTVALTVENNLHIYKERDVFVIPPYIPHSIQAFSPYTMISICISKQMVETMSIDKIEAGMMRLLNHLNNIDKISEKQVHYLADFFIFYKNYLSEPEIILSGALKELLEVFPEEKISVENMAQLVFLSKYYFIRNFKQEVGLTPHQFQLQNRIRKAQRLLHQTENITEVAMNTGFCDQSHFTKHFEKIVGLTPASYIRSCSVIKDVV